MDLQALADQHRHEWAELDELTRRPRLSADEADRLIVLYQRSGAHLAAMRGHVTDPTLTRWLSSVVARARRRATRPTGSTPAMIGRFFTHGFPGALYDMRRWWLITIGANVLIMGALMAYYLANPQIESSLLSPDEIQQLVNSDFESYYSEYAASHFALRVWTNNAWVAAQCIALGFLGLPVIIILLNNVMNIALTGSIMINHGRSDVFFGLIIPHGLLELTAVFVAAAVGLRVFWSWVQPGDLSRASALARAGRSSMTVVLGLAVVLALSGLIEAFVTPSPLPTWARIAIGVTAEVLFFAYVFTFGRAAASTGRTGDIDDALDRGASELTRA